MTATITEPTTTTEPALADLAITATGTEWLRKLAAVGAAVSIRPPVPILSFIVLECNRGKATLTGYDYSTSAVVKLNHEAVGTLHNSKALAPHSWLVRTIRVLTARKRDIPVTVAAKTLLGRPMITVTAAGFTIPRLHDVPLSEYPELPAHGELDTFDLDRDVLAAAMDRAAIAASFDDTLPILTAIEMQTSGRSLTLQSTDRYRLSSETLKLTKEVQDFRFLLPAKTWKAVARHLNGEKVTFGVLLSGDVHGKDGGRSGVHLTSGDCSFTLTGVLGDYPKIKSLFDLDFGMTLEVNRRDLIDQVIVARELNDYNEPGLLKIGPSAVTLAPSFAEGGSEVATPILLADTTNIVAPDIAAYNPQFLLDALKAINTDVVRFSFHNMVKPTCISPVAAKGDKASTYRHLLMPVRLPNRTDV
ncbi:hypothetical protein ACIPWF_00655 [Paenarthrobacter sp. NPDC089989]|uniref:DNA polymerase III subunit beta family protein n=1 Tax=unclassified Paenarthrobacter TaxID=2634190 RepID=UPI0037FFD952